MKVGGFFLAFVLITHFGYDRISEVTGVHRATVFYILMGLWTVVLCGFIQVLLWSRRAELAIKLVLYATGIGMVEGVMMLCLLAGKVPHGLNACDHLTGLPVTLTTITLYCLYLSWSLSKNAGAR